MLVIENRNRSAAGFKNRGGLLKKFVTRIERLAFLVFGIFSVLADDHNAIDGELFLPARQRLFERWINAETKSLLPFAAEIILRKLVHIHRNDIDLGLVMRTLPAVAAEQTVHKMLAVRHFANFGDNHCHFFSLR